MSSSTLILYKTKLTPSKNFMIDNFTNYIRTCQKTQVNNFQYQKIETDMTIKVFMNQAQQCNVGYNYVSIYQDSRTFYYFITNSKWISENCIELTLSMDTINTCSSQILGHFTDKTKITRQHKDRFIQGTIPDTAVSYLCRNVDNIDEGTGSVNKYKDSFDNVVVDSSQIAQKWYLIYKSASIDDNAGIYTYLCSDIKLKVSNLALGISQIAEDKIYYLLYSDNIIGNRVRINGTLYSSSDIRLSMHLGVVTYVVYQPATKTQIANGTCYWTQLQILDDVWLRISDTVISTSYELEVYINMLKSLATIDYTSNAEATFVLPISSIDKTDSTLIKIIELPYCPTKLTYNNGIYSFGYANEWSYDYTTGLMKIVNLALNTMNSTIKTAFYIPEMTTNLPVIAERKSALKNIKYESKLYKSDYYTFKYVYDSFSKEVLLENIKNTGYNARSRIDTYFYPSININSNMAFKIVTANYKELTDFDSWLICNRNNESPIYNNSYINYLRNGYNYDVKNKKQQEAYNWIGTGLQIAGAVGSFALSGATAGVSAAAGISLTTSAIASIANNINTTISAEQNISQKIQEAKAQSASVSGSDDLSLLNAYEGQALKIAKYSVSDNMKDVLFDLFHYCGYADGRQAIPNMDSRRCFNYIQCDPVFDNEDDPIWMKFVDDVKARFSAGVTYLHKFNNGTTSDWDFDQKYENFETWICDRS